MGSYGCYFSRSGTSFVTAAITIQPLSASDHAQWDAYVATQPSATFFHLAGWKTVIEQAFGHRTFFLFAQQAGQIVGILPLARVKSLLFGHSLSSLPFCVYGGVVAEAEDVREALEAEACRLADELQVDHLEMRNRHPVHDEWPKKALYVTFRKEIADSIEQNLSNIPRKQRAVVRKGIKAGLESRVDAEVNDFYALYAESVRNLGTPVFSKKYFQVLKTVFGDACEVMTVTHQGKAVSSVMNFYFRDQVLPYYGGGGVDARALKANDFMYWEVMRRACEKGLKWFDYGRSKEGTGSYAFKKNWGFVPEPLHYEFYLVKAKTVPDLNPLNPKYQIFIKTWKKLPLPVANMIGPHLVKYLG